MNDVADARKDTAGKILTDICGLSPVEITRYPNGYCHSVYYVDDVSGEYVIRITEETSKEYYLGSLKWFAELRKLDLPVPEILKHGRYEDVFFALMSFIPGKDLGDVYNTLMDSQKQDIAKSLAEVQRKVSSLPTAGLYGYSADDTMYKTWVEFLHSQLDRSSKRMMQNGIWDTDICDRVKAEITELNEYFANVPPTAFCGDITTKNVLIHNGKLSGIVDVDEICFGDPLFVIGLTNAALMCTESDTTYIDYWLNEISAGEAERKAVTLYTSLFCVDFMGEKGTRFDNGNTVQINKKTIDILNSVYFKLCNAL